MHYPRIIKNQLYQQGWRYWSNLYLRFFILTVWFQYRRIILVVNILDQLYFFCGLALFSWVISFFVGIGHLPILRLHIRSMVIIGWLAVIQDVRYQAVWRSICVCWSISSTLAYELSCHRCEYSHRDCLLTTINLPPLSLSLLLWCLCIYLLFAWICEYRIRR